ncbi:MAG: hypothetical protein ACI30J_04640 [Paludibacteraceae bacterium]
MGDLEGLCPACAGVPAGNKGGAVSRPHQSERLSSERGRLARGMSGCAGVPAC